MSLHAFFHSADLDGHCSGAIIKHRFSNAILHPINHNQPFPWETVGPEDTVFMADFALQPFDQMIRLNASCNLVWIDHHISAIESSIEARKATGEEINGRREVGKAACEIVWEYLYPDREMPRFVHLLGRYDVWDRRDPSKWDAEILPFQYGMRTNETDPSVNWQLWEMLFGADDAVYENAIIQGKTILAYTNQSNARYMRSHAYEVSFEGLRALAVNVGNVSSNFFDSMYDPARHDIRIAYSCIRRQFWAVTIYSDNPEVDCTALAKKHGGGGHKEAAGFSCKELPF